MILLPIDLVEDRCAMCMHQENLLPILTEPKVPPRMTCRTADSQKLNLQQQQQEQHQKNPHLQVFSLRFPLSPPTNGFFVLFSKYLLSSSRRRKKNRLGAKLGRTHVRKWGERYIQHVDSHTWKLWETSICTLQHCVANIWVLPASLNVFFRVAGADGGHERHRGIPEVPEVRPDKRAQREGGEFLSQTQPIVIP